MDTFSKSDPYIVLYFAGSGMLAPTGGRQLGNELGRTETIMDNLNPVFTHPIPVQFLFEAKQPLKVVVYDSDGYTDDAKNDVCGMADFLLSHVICSANGKKELPLTTPTGSQKGFVEISFSDVGASARDTVRFQFSGSGLPSGCFCSPTSAHYTLSRLNPNGSRAVVYTSEVAREECNPRWAMSPNLPLGALVGSSEGEQTIVFELLNGRSSLGSFRSSLQQLQEASASHLALAPRKEGSAKRCGEVSVEAVHIVRCPTFTSSLASGWQINMALSIDFTGSNGDPRNPTSLHYMDRTRPNQYVSAMMSVGDILMEYDADKQIPVYGFGASVGGRLSHFFNVTQSASAYVSGVQGALDAYGALLPTIVLSGPTNFAPTIRAVTEEARGGEAGRVYTVLLIITDGEISDMRDAIDALVDADDAPLSIVIVGVGTACDFQMMIELDGDDTSLVSSRGKVSRRDLVQFVPYRDFAPPKPREALAAEVLREIPDQFEEYLILAAVRTDMPAQYLNM